MKSMKGMKKKGGRANRNPSKYRGIHANGKNQKGGGGTGKSKGKMKGY